MKIILLHLSDVHLEDSPFPTVKIQGIADALKTIDDYAAIIMVVSGDLTQSGKQSQYDLLESFISSLATKLNIVRDLIFIIPGNHDVDFKDEKINRQFITQTLNNDKKLIKDYYDTRLETFYLYANNYFNVFRSDKEIDTRLLAIDKCKIQLQLLNTAYGSTVDKNDTDKGLHFFSKRTIDEIERLNPPADIYITAMHHSADYFCEENKRIIEEDIIKNSNILIVGHEHYEANKQLHLENDALIIVNGAALHTNSSESSKFNALLINTKNHSVKTHVFAWNEKQKEYRIDNQPNSKKMSICSGNLRQNVAFIESLHKMEQFNDFDIDDYYVFPPLQVYTDGSEKKEIKDTNAFDEIVKIKKTIIIEGGDFSGKTALCQYLYLRYKDFYTPVIFNRANIDSKTLNSIVQSAFNSQYNQELYTWTKFLNDKDHQKIAIVDDAHIYKHYDLNILLKELTKYFDVLILLTRTKWDYQLIDLIKERIENTAEKNTIRLSIQPLYFQKRLILIEKVCTMYQNQSGKTFDLKLTVKKLDRIISNELSIFSQNPGFTILFILFSLETNQFDTEKRVFNAAFESNITSIIQKNKDLDISTAMFILQLLAYHIHTEKKYPYPFSSLALIIESYNKDGKGYRRIIDPLQIVNDLIQTKILKKDNLTGNIIFVTDSVLAYFIAKSIISYKDYESTKKLVSNACFGINGMILLFLSYFTGDHEIIRHLMRELSALTSKIDELSFDKENVVFLFEGISKKNIEFSESSYVEYKETKDFTEQSLSSYQIEAVNIYDYNDTNFSEIDNITKVFKLIELLSRLMPDFIYDLSTEDIISIVNSLYVYPNKLLFWVLNKIDDNMGEFVKELTKILSQNKSINEYSRIDWISNVINEISIKTIFSIYHMTAKYASSINTIQALSKNPDKNNTNYMLQELFFKDGYEGTNSDEFSKEIYALHQSTKRDLIKRIVEELFKHHIVSREIKNVGEVQSKIDLLLAKPEAKKKDQSSPFNKGSKSKKPRIIDIRRKKN